MASQVPFNSSRRYPWHRKFQQKMRINPMSRQTLIGEISRVTALPRSTVRAIRALATRNAGSEPHSRTLRRHSLEVLLTWCDTDAKYGACQQ